MNKYKKDSYYWLQNGDEQVLTRYCFISNMGRYGFKFSLNGEEHFLRECDITSEMDVQEINISRSGHELEVRVWLWLNHGCKLSTLYSDNGEMRCVSCGIDFKRLPIIDLLQKYT